VVTAKHLAASIVTIAVGAGMTGHSISDDVGMFRGGPEDFGVYASTRHRQ